MTSTLTEPIPVTSTNLRPFTNKDYTNDIPYKHGLPRPLKHYRLGIINAVVMDPSGSNVNYLKTNTNRYVASSRTVPFLGLTMERPGHVFESTSNANFASDLCKDERLDGLLTDCCQADKALKRVRGSSTNLNKNYYQTSQQYRQARCNTISQKGFQYTNGGGGKYIANCSSNCYPECNEVIYKPNNAQYSQQGGVSSSSRTTRLTLNTIKKEVDGYKNRATANNFANVSGQPSIPFILKAKSDLSTTCKPKFGIFPCNDGN